MFRAVIGICVVSISILGYAEDAKPDPQKDAARIRRTAQNLLSSSEALRERAAGSLVKIGVDAVDELEALKAKRPKVAERVDAVLEKILAKALRLVDATGKPISSARVSGDYEKRVLRGPGTILNNPNGRTRPARRTGPVRASFEARTSRSGWFDRPEGLTIHRAFKVDVKHAIYGSAVGFAYFDPKTRPSETHVIRVPLVSPESEEYQRACRGRVVNETGEPIAGATLVCQYVRTTGEGLINGVDVQRVRSGSDGRFAFYLVGHQNQKRGRIIPPNSRYLLRVRADGYFPRHAEFSNGGNESIVLQKPTRAFRLEFEALEGGRTLKGAQDLSHVRLQMQSGEDRRVDLGDAFRSSLRVNLPRGELHASYDGADYAPIKIKGNSKQR